MRFYDCGVFWKKTVRRILTLSVLLSLGCAAGEGLLTEGDNRKEPTCVESGYEVHLDNGVFHIEEIPATGHRFSEWVYDDEKQIRTRVCEICGLEETIRISSVSENLLPRIDLTGSMDGIGRKSRVLLNVKYTDPEQSFECYGLCTLQGHSTFGQAKKNYMIRLYDDPDGNNRHKAAFQNWNRENKYVLKANYLDTSQCRNLVGARIWTDMVKTRENVPDRISALPTRGAVDGFPAAVYLNGDFFGLYTLNLHKDDDLYRMREDAREAIAICNVQKTAESLFRAPAAFLPDNGSDWELEFCGTEDESWARESFNELISFVMESDDLTFYDRLNEYLDVDAAVDYLIFIYALGLKDSGAKDLVMLSYGDRWIPSAYDMDEAFGLNATDRVYRAPEEFLPTFSGTEWNSATGSLLWDRLLNSFTDRIRERYSDLRRGPLSEQNLTAGVTALTSRIPEDVYDWDWYLYADRPAQFRNMDEQIARYIPARIKLLDEIFEEGDFQ